MEEIKWNIYDGGIEIFVVLKNALARERERKLANFFIYLKGIN